MKVRVLTVLVALVLALPSAHAQEAASIVSLLTEERYTPLGVPSMDTPEGVLANASRVSGLMLDETSIALVSELRGEHDRDALLARALYLIDTGLRGMTLAEGFLDENAIDERLADRLAIALETSFPLSAARGAALASAVIAKTEPEAAARLAELALRFADHVSADTALLHLTRGHALRLLGRYADAQGSFARVPEAIERHRSSNDRHYRQEAALGAVLALYADGENPEGASAALARVGEALRDAEHPLTGVLIADVAYTIDGDAATPGRHIALFERFLRDDPPTTRMGYVLPSLAQIGGRLGGLRSPENVPAECLLAIGVTSSGNDRDALRLAYERAETMREVRPEFWAYAAYLFALASASGDEHSALRVRALLDLAEAPISRSMRFDVAAQLKWLNSGSGLSPDRRDRWVGLLRSRDDLLTPPRSEHEDYLLDLALLNELVRRVDAESAPQVVAEADGVLSAEATAETRFAHLRVLGAALRLGDMNGAQRAALAERTLKDALRVQEMYEKSEQPVSDQARAWDVYGADALLVLGRYNEALDLLAVADDNTRNGGFIGFSYINSVRRVRLHAYVMTGAYDEAVGELVRLTRPGDLAFLLPGTPFQPEAGLGEVLASSFVGDEHDPTAREVTEARYAIVRDRFVRAQRRTPGASDCLGHAAILIRAGLGVEALELLDSCEADSSGARLLRAEALLRSGEDAAAFAIYRELATALGVTADWRASREHWHAWARMLEILQRQNDDGSRSQQIADSVRRLRALPSWGEHDEATRRIEAVASRVSD